MSLELVLLLALALVLFAAVGPRARAEDRLSFHPGRLGAAAGHDLAARLTASERQVPDLRPALFKEIIWQAPDTPARTEWAVIYVHGFSASKEELRPLPDRIAETLGANLFLTRLAGHGRTRAAMAEPSADDWLDDMAEAVEVGRRIGRKVLVIGNSTGATLATWAALRPDLGRQIDALVLISPNYEVIANGSFFLTLPWVRTILNRLYPTMRACREAYPCADHDWSEQYPTEALLPMAAAVRHVQSLPLDEARQPVLFIHSPVDQVISPTHVVSAHESWGCPVKDRLEIVDSEDPYHHTLAGRIISPSTTEPLVHDILSWIEALPEVIPEPVGDRSRNRSGRGRDGGIGGSVDDTILAEA